MLRRAASPRLDLRAVANRGQTDASPLGIRGCSRCPAVTAIPMATAIPRPLSGLCPPSTARPAAKIPQNASRAPGSGHPSGGRAPADRGMHAECHPRPVPARPYVFWTKSLGQRSGFEVSADHAPGDDARADGGGGRPAPPGNGSSGSSGDVQTRHWLAFMTDTRRVRVEAITGDGFAIRAVVSDADPGSEGET